MIQTFFIHPHESINFHCQDLSFLLKFIIMEEAKGFLVHKKRWVVLWKDKSSKWLLDSENQRCQKQGFLQINVALEVNDHSRLVCQSWWNKSLLKSCFVFFRETPFNKWQTPPELLLFQTRFLRRFPHERSAWPIWPQEWSSYLGEVAEEMLVPLTPLKKKVYSHTHMLYVWNIHLHLP